MSNVTWPNPENRSHLFRLSNNGDINRLLRESVKLASCFYCWRFIRLKYINVNEKNKNKKLLYINPHRAVLWAVQLVRSHRAPRPATNGIEHTPRNAIANGPRGAPLHTSHRAPRQPGTALNPHMWWTLVMIIFSVYFEGIYSWVKQLHI